MVNLFFADNPPTISKWSTDYFQMVGAHVRGGLEIKSKVVQILQSLKRRNSNSPPLLQSRLPWRYVAKIMEMDADKL